MNRTWLAAIAGSLWLLLAPSMNSAQKQPAEKKTQEPNPVVIRLGNEQIRTSEAEAMLNDLPPESRAYYGTLGRRQFADYLVTLKVLAREGERLKLAERPKTRQALAIARASILADAARREIESTVPLSPPEIEQYHGEHAREFEKVRLRRLLIRSASSMSSQQDSSRATAIPTDQQAQKRLEEFRQRILAGDDFAELAREHSDDLDTAGRGGEVGWLGRGQQPWFDSAFALEPGQLSPVFQSPFGFELLRVDERRTPPLEEVRGQIEQLLRRQKAEELVRQLKQSLHTSIDEEYFKPTAPPPAARPSPFVVMPPPQPR